MNKKILHNFLINKLLKKKDFSKCQLIQYFNLKKSNII